MRAVRTFLALLGCGWVAVAPAGRLAANTLYVYVDCPVGAPNLPVTTGHAFVQLAPSAGPQAGSTNLVYGLYPATRNVLGGAGMISSDAGRRWDFRICYPLTRAQYNAAALAVSGDITAPPAYHLLNFNCVDWANRIAAAAGQTLPAFLNRVPAADPNALWTSLSGLGAGGVFMGGTVGDNPGNTAANGGPVSATPLDYTYEGLALAGATEATAGAMAAQMGLPFQALHLGDVAVGAGQGLTVDVADAVPGEMLLAAHWGDGSDSDLQQAAFTHSYAAPGLYSGALVVITGGAVLFADWTAVVGGGGPAELLVNAPAEPPNFEENPGLIPPELIREIEDEVGPLTVVSQPQPVTVNEGEPFFVSFSVSGPNAAHQWFKDGAPLANGRLNPYEVEHAVPADSGTYFARATNDFPSDLTSDAVVVTVTADTTPPVLQHALAGAALEEILLTFSEPVDPVSAGQVGSYSVDNGLIVLGASEVNFNQVLLVTTPRTPGFTYNVTVRDVTDVSVARNPLSPNPTTVPLQEASPPVIVTPPADQTVPGGNPVTFTVGVDSLAPVTFQWRYNGADIPEATGAELVLFNVQPPLEGEYSVVVSNRAGMAASAPGRLTVANAAPFFDPVSPRTVVAGHDLVVGLVAEDFDEPAQALTYSLAPGAPPGATVDPDTGFLTWPAGHGEVGETKTFTVLVQDNGAPPQSAEITFTATVLPPIPAPTPLSIERLGDQVQLRWQGEPGVTYQVIRKPTPDSPTGELVCDFPSEGGRITVRDRIKGQEGYYCLVLLAPKACAANEPEKELVYSRGNNDAVQLKRQFDATKKLHDSDPKKHPPPTYVYETGTLELKLKAKPACTCNESNQCVGEITLTVDFKFEEATVCGEGKATTYRFMDGLEVPAADAARRTDNRTPAPNVEAKTGELTFIKANKINENGKTYTSTAQAKTPCTPGTYHRRFSFTTARAGDKQTPGNGAPAFYLDVAVAVTEVEACKLNVSLAGNYLEYLPRYPWRTQGGGMVANATNELAKVKYTVPGVNGAAPDDPGGPGRRPNDRDDGVTFNIAKLIKECGKEVDKPFPKKQ